jgi:phage-related protein
MGKIGGFVNNVMGGIKSFFGIKSPSRRVAKEVGVQIPAGLGVGVEANTDAATQSIDDMNKQVMLEAGKLGSMSVDQTVTQQIIGSAVPMSGITATPSAGAGAQTVIISGPLVSVAEMSVRDDRDIRTLSTQLKTDMTRELRAQGVLA